MHFSTKILGSTAGAGGGVAEPALAGKAPLNTRYFFKLIESNLQAKDDVHPLVCG